MAETQRFAERDVVARQYQYADGDVLAFDLGAGATGAVDVVDGTLVVVVDDDQFEMELDGRPAQATINNGVVTVEMRGSTAGVDGEAVDIDAPGGVNEAEEDTEEER
jgi:hypothetical protein